MIRGPKVEMSRSGWIPKIVVSILLAAIFYVLWEWDSRAFFLFLAFSIISPIYNIFYTFQQFRKELDL